MSTIQIVLKQTGDATYSFLTVDQASGEVTVSEEIDREKFTSIDNVFYVHFRVQSDLVIRGLIFTC